MAQVFYASTPHVPNRSGSGGGVGGSGESGPLGAVGVVGAALKTFEVANRATTSYLLPAPLVVLRVPLLLPLYRFDVSVAAVLEGEKEEKAQCK